MFTSIWADAGPSGRLQLCLLSCGRRPTEPRWTPGPWCPPLLGAACSSGSPRHPAASNRQQIELGTLWGPACPAQEHLQMNLLLQAGEVASTRACPVSTPVHPSLAQPAPHYETLVLQPGEGACRTTWTATDLGGFSSPSSLPVPTLHAARLREPGGTERAPRPPTPRSCPSPAAGGTRREGRGGVWHGGGRVRSRGCMCIIRICDSQTLSVLLPCLRNVGAQARQCPVPETVVGETHCPVDSRSPLRVPAARHCVNIEVRVPLVTVLVLSFCFLNRGRSPCAHPGPVQMPESPELPPPSPCGPSRAHVAVRCGQRGVGPSTAAFLGVGAGGQLPVWVWSTPEPGQPG